MTMQSYSERPLFFDCEGSALLGIVSVPERPASVGVVIVVGGPQYRVGSHRQFVVLARARAAAGIACLRFDLRGMGDSEGAPIPFDRATPDVLAAVDALGRSVIGVETVVLWGLCDGAAACAFAAGLDARIRGLVLLNPWVRTEAGAAKVQLRDHYGRRVVDPAFWRKLARGKVDLAESVRGGLRAARGALTGGARDRLEGESASLPERFGRGLARHSGAVLVVLSGRDSVAAEFRLAAAHEPTLARALAKVEATTVEVADADHTFSSAGAREVASRATLEWLRRSFPESPPSGPEDAAPNRNADA